MKVLFAMKISVKQKFSRQFKHKAQTRAYYFVWKTKMVAKFKY